MSAIDCCYVTLPDAALTQQIVDDCIETSLGSVRRSVDALEAIVKFHPPKPSSLVAYDHIDHEIAIALMNTADWDGMV